MARYVGDSIPDDPLYIMARYVGVRAPEARRLVELNRLLGILVKASAP